MVINEVQIHLGSLVSAPCKYVNIFPEKIYQLFLLLKRQLNSDLEEFILIVANNNFFQLLTLSPFCRYSETTLAPLIAIIPSLQRPRTRPQSDI